MRSIGGKVYDILFLVYRDNLGVVVKLSSISIDGARWRSFSYEWPNGLGSRVCFAEHSRLN